jgi:hypothetical protein
MLVAGQMVDMTTNLQSNDDKFTVKNLRYDDKFTVFNDFKKYVVNKVL